jgi:hypothetical protein
MNAWYRSDSRDPLSSWKRSPQTLPIFDNAQISGLVTSATSVATVFTHTRASGHFGAMPMLSGLPASRVTIPVFGAIVAASLACTAA